MAKFFSEILSLIQATRSLLEEEKIFIASQEDCSYFREFVRPNKFAYSPLDPIQSHQNRALLPNITKTNPKNSEKKFFSKNPSQETIVAPSPQALSQKKEPNLSPQESSSLRKSSSLRHKQEFEEIRALLKRIAPNLQILEEIPEDREACLLAERWKVATKNSPVILLFLDEHPLETKFLHHLKDALNQLIAETSLIEVRALEECNHWSSLLSSKEIKHVIITEALLKRLPNLLTLYRINPVSSSRFLLNVPVMVLPPLNNYLATPSLKRSLWVDLKLFITEPR